MTTIVVSSAPPEDCNKYPQKPVEMLKAFPVILFIALCVLLFSTNAHSQVQSEAQSQSRHALVIGNSEYGSGFSLVNPRNDTTAIAAKLSAIGYKVHKGGALYDLKIDEFNNEIDSFLDSLEDGASTLIYYAGHGSASTGSNFLIPILPAGVRLKTESDIRNRSISLESIMERIQIHNPSGVNVLFLDACRDAPVDTFSRSINLTGLTNLDTRRQPQGSFIGFSTEYGEVAVDGDGTGFSPFASAVLNNLDTRAAAPIELFYKSVSKDVYQSTSGQQFPIQEPKIRGDYCLVPCESNATTDTIQEFGYLTVNTKPLNAEVCYLVEDEWKNWNCGQQMVLPIGKPVEVRVTAKNHKTYTTTTTLRRQRQQLAVNLEQKSRNGFKIAGAIAALVVTGILLSDKDDSGSGQQQGGYQIILTPPSQ